MTSRPTFLKPANLSIDKTYLLKTVKDFCEIERDDVFETITTFAHTYLR